MNRNNTLLFVYPNVAKYWDSSRNTVSPSEVSKGSGKAYWWKCPEGLEEHAFEMTVHNRVRKERICPFCSGKRVSDINSLATVAPEIAVLWHPILNGDTKPSMVTRYSGKKYWFICPKRHDFLSKPADLSIGECPYCSGKKFSPEVSLATMKPEIYAQWHPTKNIDLEPDNINYNSSKMAWFICPFGHEFYAPINARTNLIAGCKKCKPEAHTSLIEQTLFYYIRKAFTDAENRYLYTCRKKKAIEFDIYIPSVQIAIEYDGFFHNSESSKRRDQFKNSVCLRESIRLIRIREVGLPSLSPEAMLTTSFNYSPKPKKVNSLVEQVLLNLQTIQPFQYDFSLIQFESDQVIIMNDFIHRQKENSLLKIYPNLAKEWHQTKNHNLQPDMFKPHSHKKVWWQCEKNSEHEWKAIISNRSYLNYGCPYCANQIVTKETSLAYRYSDLLKFWHPTMNLPLRPEKVFPGTSQKVWWICSNNHEHEMSIAKKVERHTSCPYCHGKKVNEENAFSVLHPELLKEWHSTLNVVLPNKLTAGSTKKIWWQCRENPKHVWEASVTKRVNGRNCPYCANKKVLPEESLASKRPDLMKQWHPKNSISPEDLSEKSNRKVWWICTKNLEHEWQAVISSKKKYPVQSVKTRKYL